MDHGLHDAKVFEDMLTGGVSRLPHRQSSKVFEDMLTGGILRVPHRQLGLQSVGSNRNDALTNSSRATTIPSPPKLPPQFELEGSSILNSRSVGVLGYVGGMRSKSDSPLPPLSNMTDGHLEDPRSKHAPVLCQHQAHHSLCGSLRFTPRVVTSLCRTRTKALPAVFEELSADASWTLLPCLAEPDLGSWVTLIGKELGEQGICMRLRTDVPTNVGRVKE